MVYAAYLLDIEGTTTPVDFVYKTLFPFARRALPGFLAGAAPEPAALATELALLADEHRADRAAGRSPPPWDERDAAGVVPYLLWLMDQDRKSRGLKSLQGRIWAQGYRSGSLHGELYPDVEPALRRWHERGARIYIFSSGSVLAQKLLFAHLPGGDLTPLLDDHFDTEIDSKRKTTNYARIAAELALPAAAILFLSDTPEELTAARAAGLAAVQVHRDPAAPPGAGIRSFAELP